MTGWICGGGCERTRQEEEERKMKSYIGEEVYGFIFKAARANAKAEDDLG